MQTLFLFFFDANQTGHFKLDRMIPQTLKAYLAKVLGAAFSKEEIDELGKRLESRFNSHIVSGAPFGITLRPEQAAEAAIEYFSKRNQLFDFLSILVTVEAQGKEISEFDSFLQKLGQVGFTYDPNTHQFIKARNEEEKDPWGYMKEGEIYHFSFLSIDIAGNSIIQQKYPKSDIEVTYSNIYNIIQGIVRRYKGKMWTWAGDGGIAAFYVDDKVSDSVLSAMEILMQLTIFNLDPRKNLFPENIKLRIAAHDGMTVYKENKGTILSEAINFVSHLEKSGTDVYGLSISETVHRKLNERLRSVFISKGEFEGLETFGLDMRFPWLTIQ